MKKDVFEEGELKLSQKEERIKEKALPLQTRRGFTNGRTGTDNVPYGRGEVF